MVTYCFLHPKDGILERAFPMGQAPAFLQFEDGSIAPRNFQAEHVSGSIVGSENSVKSRPKRTWPMEPCVASGVHASQAQELRDHYKKHGLSIEVPPSGDPIYESAAQRKKGLKCRGMHDRNSFN